MRTRFTIQEPCDCGAEDCDDCNPCQISAEKRSRIMRDEAQEQSRIDAMPDVRLGGRRNFDHF